MVQWRKRRRPLISIARHASHETIVHTFLFSIPHVFFKVKMRKTTVECKMLWATINICIFSFQFSVFEYNWPMAIRPNLLIRFFFNFLNQFFVFFYYKLPFASHCAAWVVIVNLFQILFYLIYMLKKQITVRLAIGRLIGFCLNHSTASFRLPTASIVPDCLPNSYGLLFTFES